MLSAVGKYFTKSVDVIIPLYNGQSYIRETLDSALAQTLKPNRIIVVDDGSTDDSLGFVYDRPEISTFKNPGKGANMARNHGLEQSDADFVAFLDQDDVWHPDHLRLLLNAFNHHPEARAAISGINFCRKFPPEFDVSDVSFSLWDPWESFPLIFEDHSTSAMVFRRDKFMEIGGWAVRHGGQADYFAWYRSAMDVPAIKEKAVTLGYRLQYDAGWMSELRRDVPGLLESLINTSKDLVEIKLLRNPEEPERLFLKRRISVYENVYSLINNLVKTRDSLIARDIQSLEGVLADETEHFKRLFMVDLEYFIDNLAVNQERLRLGYLLTLQKNSSVRSKNMNLIVSSLLDRIEPIIRNN